MDNRKQPMVNPVAKFIAELMKILTELLIKSHERRTNDLLSGLTFDFDVSLQFMEALKGGEVNKPGETTNEAHRTEASSVPVTPLEAQQNRTRIAIHEMLLERFCTVPSLKEKFLAKIAEKNSSRSFLANGLVDTGLNESSIPTNKNSLNSPLNCDMDYANAQNVQQPSASVQSEQMMGSERKLKYPSHERRYICDYDFCGLRFQHSAALARHRLVHVDRAVRTRYPCPRNECDRVYLSRDALRVHLKKHDRTTWMDV